MNQLCEICWQKVDEFNQFCAQVENIQASYNKHFLQEDGSFVTFKDPNQYHAEIDQIHSEFADEMFHNQTDGKKNNIEPFCMINIDDKDLAKIPNDLSEKVIDSTQMKQEQRHFNVEWSCSDVLETAAEGLSDCEDDVSYFYEDEDEYEEDDEGDAADENVDSSDTSFESNEKRQKVTVKKTSSKKSSKKRICGEKSSKQMKKHSKKISVTTFKFNVVDEDNKRLLSYVQMKCDVCSDDRVFDSFSEIQTHFMNAHNQSNGYIICCNRKFRRIGRVLQHCTWHDNPEAFKCDSCNKCFQDNVCLRDHKISMHIPPDERRFQCDQCSRLFAKQHLLNTHLKMKVNN